MGDVDGNEKRYKYLPKKKFYLNIGIGIGLVVVKQSKSLKVILYYRTIKKYQTRSNDCWCRKRT